MQRVPSPPLRLGLRPRLHPPILAAVAVLAACLGLSCLQHAPALADPPGSSAVLPAPGGLGLVTVRPQAAGLSRQRLRQFEGISGRNSGARGLSLNRIVIPAGGRAQAHRHVGYESAIYLLQGRVRTYYGDRLQYSIVNQAGDFLFIPADVVHQPVNLSASEDAIAIVARNDANEQEHVELHDVKLRDVNPSGARQPPPPR